MGCDQYCYVLVGFMASLLGFVFLYDFNAKKRNRANLMEEKTNGFLKVSQNGISLRPETSGNNNNDVIIVGAGVAGAALAYTLGKVSIFLYFYYDFGGCKVNVEFIFLMN